MCGAVTAQEGRNEEFIWLVGDGIYVGVCTGAEEYGTIINIWFLQLFGICTQPRNTKWKLFPTVLIPSSTLH